MKHPIASRLFQHLSVDVALAGDILEEYERGHARIWYATQVVAALGVSLSGALRAHKLLALRAISIGLAAEWAFSVIGWNLVYPWIHGRLMTSVRWWVASLF